MFCSSKKSIDSGKNLYFSRFTLFILNHSRALITLSIRSIELFSLFKSTHLAYHYSKFTTTELKILALGPNFSHFAQQKLIIKNISLILLSIINIPKQISKKIIMGFKVAPSNVKPIIPHWCAAILLNTKFSHYAVFFYHLTSRLQ